MVQMIRRVGIMAMRAWDFSEYAAIEPMAPAALPALRLVETPPEAKPMPPAWLIAPPFRPEPAMSVHEPQAIYRPQPGTPDGPYQNIRQVPRRGW